jgi:hypothetical protein
MPTVRIFEYIPELDAFRITGQYHQLADYLGLTEWHAAVWIGRLFTLDNDYGEHWFDGWPGLEAIEGRARELGIDPYDLKLVDPEHFVNGQDGPCHPPQLRKRFWTDVLKSLELSYELLLDMAREMNAPLKEVYPEEYIEDLERRIRRIRAALDRRIRQQGLPEGPSAAEEGTL